MNKKIHESIKYPINISGDVSRTRRISLDIGGSLAKVVYIVKDDQDNESEYLSFEQIHQGLRQGFQLRFVQFETKYIEPCLEFIQEHFMNSGSLDSRLIHATGGGAGKFKELFKNKLGLELQKEDEMECVVNGSIFLLTNVKNECFTFDIKHFPSFTYMQFSEDTVFPFLLANIGSGISFIKVESNNKFERVGGTSLGGGTFWGLGSLLTDATNFDELLNLAWQGNSEKVDMLVADIYGGDYHLLKLPKTLVASSFGKCVRSYYENETYDKKHFSQSDIALSLLRMISYNIGQLAVLYAQLNGLTRIYFGGSFINNDLLPVLNISQAVAFFSQTKIIPLFFKHHSFLGAVGAFQAGVVRDQKCNIDINGIKKTLDSSKGQFFENIATSSFSDYSVAKHNHPIKILSLNFDSSCTSTFPLLVRGGNLPVDRSFIIEYADYIEKWVPLFITDFKRQHSSNHEQFEHLYSNFISMIMKRLECYRSSDPFKVPNFLSDIFYLQDSFVKEFLVLDPLLNFKHQQNLNAINEYKEFLNVLKTLSSVSHRHSLIFDHLFAGNLIDYSSNEFLLSSELFTQTSCYKTITNSSRHFIGGTFKTWINAFTSKKWKKVMIFIDNSGFELIFGVFSLVREFLNAGVHVVLAANTYPSFNDVVSTELSLIINRIRRFCPIIDKLVDSMVTIVQTGFSSPLLTLEQTHHELTKAATDTNLIIITGLSRSLIGFFDAKFKCDVLYIGTATSKIFADRFDFDIFDTFMKFDFV